MTRNTDITPKVRRTVLGRDMGACVVCAATYALQVHHRRPRGMGGSRRPETNLPGNLLTLCAGHHRWVELNRATALALGLLVSQHDTPTEVPVKTWRGWVTHDDAGKYHPTNGADE